MKLKLGIVMDPIANIHIEKDSSFALLLAAQQRGWELYYMEANDLLVQQNQAFAQMRRLTVQYHAEHWYQLAATELLPLSSLSAILMRKDPPFTLDYIYLTYILELAAKAGTPVFNNPTSLRDANEKMAITWFPDCIAPTLVTSQIALILTFLSEQQDIIVKPLDEMGGSNIFRLTAHDPNIAAILENITHNNQKLVMAQQYLPAIAQGDKRIILVDGEPIPYCLARIPAPGETRGNLARGGTGQCQPLSERDKWLCQQVGPTLRAKGLFLVGLDVIGDYITEINVTSPTCLVQISQASGIAIADQVIAKIEQLL
jgi:glutathione synthase